MQTVDVIWKVQPRESINEIDMQNEIGLLPVRIPSEIGVGTFWKGRMAALFYLLLRIQ